MPVPYKCQVSAGTALLRLWTNAVVTPVPCNASVNHMVPVGTSVSAPGMLGWSCVKSYKFPQIMAPAQCKHQPVPGDIWKIDHMWMNGKANYNFPSLLATAISCMRGRSLLRTCHSFLSPDAQKMLLTGRSKQCRTANYFTALLDNCPFGYGLNSSPYSTAFPIGSALILSEVHLTIGSYPEGLC